MEFNPKCLATAIGSMPQENPEKACDVILSSIPEIPIWPQLPNTNFREEMEIQYSEGFPCVELDEAKQRMFFKTDVDITSDFEKFYENYLADNLDHFKITPEYSRGIYAMEQRLLNNPPSELQFFKSHVTGPMTVGLGRVDENKRAIYYNDMFRDLIIKGTEMKVRWMLNRFKFLGCPQILFLDEPILSAFGSSTYVSVQRPEVVEHLQECISAVHKEGALAGVHCCGNTEWTILIDAGADIISFDAYDYAESIAYYPDQIKTFLEKGGVLAWGIVPTSEKIHLETPDSLVEKLKAGVDHLASKGINADLIWAKCLLTPSCGTGSLSVEMSEKIFEQLSQVSQILRA